ncbi:PREDICTED: uncharacterized protein LOC104769504 [Camelina sativa]|uniref:Uncharacterized protein LOC104769504 n=1 Tax=Camelina sativa TaxID=90675 RepID=A0ABM0XWJ1_CAMSA|nr:PREDICTED: uncharacterized protein LOC104769504 [Camelina sativa]
MASKRLGLFAVRSIKPRRFGSSSGDNGALQGELKNEIKKLNVAIETRNSTRKSDLSNWRDEYEDNLDKTINKLKLIQTEHTADMLKAAERKIGESKHGSREATCGSTS